MGESLIFDWMCDDTVYAHIECYAGVNEVLCEEKQPIIALQFLGLQPHTMQYVLKRLEGRCPSKGRPDLKEILAYQGLTQYSILDWVKVTHGVCPNDKFWLRFDGETITYEDAKELMDVEKFAPSERGDYNAKGNNGPVYGK